MFEPIEQNPPPVNVYKPTRNMVTTTVYLKPEQYEKLQAFKAQYEHFNISEFIRLAIDDGITKFESVRNYINETKTDLP